jgi:hypothetical protein
MGAGTPANKTFDFDFGFGCEEGGGGHPPKYFDFDFGHTEGGHAHQNTLTLALDAQRGADTTTKIL